MYLNLTYIYILFISSALSLLRNKVNSGALILNLFLPVELFSVLMLMFTYILTLLGFCDLKIYVSGIISNHSCEKCFSFEIMFRVFIYVETSRFEAF
jgi:hypothetical protein